MGKAKALLISVGMASIAIAGAATAMRGVSLGPTASKPPGVAPAAIAASQSKLDRWSAELRKQRSAKPPRLPAVPHFARVVIPRLPTPRAFVVDTTATAAAAPQSTAVHATLRVAMSKAAPTTTDTTTAPLSTLPETADDTPTTTDDVGGDTATDSQTTAAEAPTTRSGGNDGHSDDGQSDDGHTDDGHTEPDD